MGERRTHADHERLEAIEQTGDPDVEPFAWLHDLFTRLPYHRGGRAFSQCQAEQAVTSD